MNLGFEKKIFEWAELGYIPDLLVRAGIRRICRETSLKARCASEADREARMRAFVAEMDASPIALAPAESNEQHYEVPSAFFAEVLGPHRKYSSCYWPESTTRLEQAEVESLERTCANAQIEDGHSILELGCGWGSLTLFMAARYPNARVTAVSHSSTQRETIMALAQERSLTNVEVITCDMNDFEAPDPGTYDRVVSVEMFEHMRNQRKLLSRVATWLKPGGKILIHVFCHKDTAYPYIDSGQPNDWMTRHFFAGGMMPSDDLLTRFQDDLRFEEQWRWNGKHYARTLEAWLQLMDSKRDTVWPILEATYGEDVRAWWGRWRLFFMACAEFFALEDGEEWYISHYRLARPDDPS
jgi:cyclopropane-fatty-acyl-phospholipid synthase